jgi:hypothetical protein
VILVLGGLTGWMPLALAVVAAGSAITAGQRIALAHRLMRELDLRRAEEASRVA